MSVPGTRSGIEPQPKVQFIYTGPASQIEANATMKTGKEKNVSQVNGDKTYKTLFYTLSL
jgi:hypothetical protein